jgi:hypothetical protein
LTDGDGEEYRDSALLIVNGRFVYLPAVMR